MCIAFGCAVFLLVGCKSPPAALPLQRYSFESAHMGTLFTITLYATTESAAEQAAHGAFVKVNALEEIMSDYRADSELNLLRGQPVGKPVAVSDELFRVLEEAQKLSILSEGAFDVTVGPYTRLWRFSRKRKTLPAPVELSEARAAVGYRHLRLDRAHRTVTQLVPNMRLDVGGIAKGFAADEALAVLRRHDITRALVAASGDIAVGDPPPGQKAWKIGVSALGQSSTNVSLTVYLHNAAVSTSGDTEQFVDIEGVRYSHILDPRTGLGLTNRIQATVIAPRATLTDPLATVACILGTKRGIRLVSAIPGGAVLVTTADGRLRTTVGSRRFREFLK